MGMLQREINPLPDKPCFFRFLCLLHLGPFPDSPPTPTSSYLEKAVVTVGQGVASRIEFLWSTLFPSDDAGAALLLRAVSRNPSLLTYDVEVTMCPCVALYQSLGVDPHALGRLLVSRPTIIPRSALDPEKLPPRSVLNEPALLYCNLEKVLRPRPPPTPAEGSGKRRKKRMQKGAAPEERVEPERACRACDAAAVGALHH